MVKWTVKCESNSSLKQGEAHGSGSVAENCGLWCLKPAAPGKDGVDGDSLRKVRDAE